MIIRSALLVGTTLIGMVSTSDAQAGCFGKRKCCQETPVVCPQACSQPTACGVPPLNNCGSSQAGQSRTADGEMRTYQDKVTVFQTLPDGTRIAREETRARTVFVPNSQLIREQSDEIIKLRSDLKTALDLFDVNKASKKELQDGLEKKQDKQPAVSN